LIAEKKRPSEAVRRNLVVDDEPAVAGTLCDYLVSNGYDADVAPNGRDALALFERKRPDVALLDIAMPGMDGVEVLWRLKAIDVTIPVIVVTPNADERKARKAGAFDPRHEALPPRPTLGGGRPRPGTRGGRQAARGAAARDDARGNGEAWNPHRRRRPESQ